MISGMYLGDCVRRVLVRMAQEAGIFGTCVPHKLLEAFSLQYVEYFKYIYIFEDMSTILIFMPVQYKLHYSSRVI